MEDGISYVYYFEVVTADAWLWFTSFISWYSETSSIVWGFQLFPTNPKFLIYQ